MKIEANDILAYIEKCRTLSFCDGTVLEILVADTKRLISGKTENMSKIGHILQGVNQEKFRIKTLEWKNKQTGYRYHSVEVYYGDYRIGVKTFANGGGGKCLNTACKLIGCTFDELCDMKKNGKINETHLMATNKKDLYFKV